MNIPDSIIQDIIDVAAMSLSEIYTQHIYKNTRIEFSLFFNSVLSEVLGEVEHLLEVNHETLLPIIRKRWQTKKRWMDKELATEGTYYEEVELIAKGVYQQFSDQPGKFKLLYGYDTYEELKAARIEEMKNWVKQEDVPVCQFRYLQGKQVHNLKKAMHNDIEYLILKTIKERCPSGMQSAIMAMPHSLSNVPIDFTNRARINNNSVIIKGHEEYFVNKYYIDDDTFLENLLNVEILKTGVISTVLKTLNATDIHIFLYVMSLRDENFYNTREVVVDIGDIVRNVFASDGKKNYTTVKESLYRMQFLNSGAIDSSLRGFTVKILDNVNIYNSDDTKETARVTVNIDIVNEYIKNQTINMYKEIIDKFSLESSKVAIFPLQRERIRCSAHTKDGEPLLFQTNINFFRGILYFSNKRKRENVKLIERTLEEIISNRITVKGFERKGDTFLLEFYPITNQERRDLMNNSDSKRFLDLPEQMELDIS